jgi:hypothetical protein
MGISTDGILFWGIDYGEDFEWPEGCEATEDALAKQAGLREPEADYPDLRQPGTWKEREPTPEEKVVQDAYSAHWKRKRELEEALPAEVGYHCSDGCPMLFIAPKRLSFSAWRGYPKTLDFTGLQPTAEDKAAVKQLVDILGFEWSEPEWHLASYCG